jgi:ferredoxin
MPELTLQFGGVDIAAEPGDSLLSAVRRSAKNIQSICGGRGMCGTCRVAVAPEWLNRLSPPAFAELRLLRVLKAGAENHRLACQIILDPAHNGLTVMPDPPPTKVLLKETTI